MLFGTMVSLVELLRNRALFILVAFLVCVGCQREVGSAVYIKEFQIGPGDLGRRKQELRGIEAWLLEQGFQASSEPTVLARLQRQQYINHEDGVKMFKKALSPDTSDSVLYVHYCPGWPSEDQWWITFEERLSGTPKQWAAERKKAADIASDFVGAFSEVGIAPTVEASSLPEGE